MPPSAIIDTDWNGTLYFALEADGLWKATGIGGGAAAWTQVMTTATFTDVTVTVFSRVRAVGSTVYVLGVANGTDAYIFVSTNSGTTWHAYEIAADSITSKPYTVTTSAAMGGRPFYDPYTEIALNNVLTRVGDESNTHSPFAIVVQGWGDTPGGGLDVWIRGVASANSMIPGYADTEIHMLADPNVYKNNALTVGEYNNLLTYLDDYFGSGVWNWADSMDRSMPNEPAYNRMDFQIYHGEGGGGVSVWAFWDVVDANAPVALDCSRTVPNWVYVGLDDKIVASEDGGVTWFEFYATVGANDICVDPQLAGAIYIWSSTGGLDLIVKQTLGQPGVLNATLDTETPVKIPLRLARDPSSGRLWAVKSGTTLRCRNLATWADQKTSLAYGRGLHAYSGGKLIMTDASGIWTSEDYGATITDKKGGWTGYGNGINGHRLMP
jgi:hypothetical protein